MILLDIEGTTTPISFVTETLFPYARSHLAPFLERNGRSIDGLKIIGRLHREHAVDRRRSAVVPPWSAKGYAEWLMDQDRKSPALKELQGRIWEEGYKDGSLAGQVFEDVPRAFMRWRDAGVPIAIYSSGSVRAQQWLFRTTAAGDLTPFISHHFDTAVGPKNDPGSYVRLAKTVGLEPGAIAFVSDVVSELHAARMAGFATIFSERQGNRPQPAHTHRVVRSFDDISDPL
ncbi:MAG: acireductone synthase [Vicinamibacterales bacterium]